MAAFISGFSSRGCDLIYFRDVNATHDEFLAGSTRAI
jgi:hypothetical protein